VKTILRITVLIAVVGAWAGVSTNANAELTWSSPLTLSSPNVVGDAGFVTGDGGGNPTVLTAVAQELLSLPVNADVNLANIPSGSSTRTFLTGPTDYQNLGTLTLGLTDDTGNTSVPSGYKYAIAQYDGPNAGYVLFYLGGSAADLPADSYSLWGGNSGQYGLSHYDTFDAMPVPEPATMTLLLLPFGAGILRVLRKSRLA
jgi:hypothetical protein